LARYIPHDRKSSIPHNRVRIGKHGQDKFNCFSVAVLLEIFKPVRRAIVMLLFNNEAASAEESIGSS
jgi:hypothetical protein